MAASPGLLAELRALGLDPRPDEPLHRHAFWRIGGPAEVLVEVPTLAGLRGILRLGLPVTVLGNGSNLLVADAGLPGLCLRLAGEWRALRLGEGEAWVGAGLNNTALLARLDRLGLGGLGCLAGIPGTLGGALRMNAGSQMGEIGAALIEAELLLPEGEVIRLPAEALDLGYRTCRLPGGAVILGLRLRLQADPARVAAERAAIRRHLDHRKATQPLDLPSCGSVFRNPPGQAAGRLIEAVGLKGTQRGQARISDKHANFIVNLGGARAADCAELIRLAQRRVEEEHGVGLEPEVHAVGAWPEPPWREAPASAASPSG